MSKKTQHHVLGKLRMISVVGVSSTCLLLYVFFFVFYSGKNIIRPAVTAKIASNVTAKIANKVTAKITSNDGGSPAQMDMYTGLADEVRRFGDPTRRTFVNMFQPHEIEGQKRKGAADKVVVCVVPKGARYGCKHISQHTHIHSHVCVYFLMLSC